MSAIENEWITLVDKRYLAKLEGGQHGLRINTWQGEDANYHWGYCIAGDWASEEYDHGLLGEQYQEHLK